MYRRLLPIVLAVLSLSASAACGQVTPDAVISRLQEMTSGASLREWKYTVDDVSQSVAPDYDDSAWKNGSPEFEWGNTPLAWLRRIVVIPERVGGMPVSGSKVTFHAAVDDDGECYVNGELKQKFHWDGCNVTLTENARPGDRYVIVVKGINTGGPGRLLAASLKYSVLSDIRATAGEVILDMSMSQMFIAHEKDKAKQDKYRAALNAAAGLIDIDALERGDKQAFIASVTIARKELKPISDMAKENTVHLIGHGHIDMNWLWLWPETLDVCRNTFTTVLKLMDEFPEFRYSQSQASTYIAIEETEPELFKRIQERVKAGQWEITGGTWVEGDMNMASGESIVRQILYAKQYFKQKFNVEPVICWEPDTFGHAWTIPQILAKSGLKYYYFMRCGRNEPVFWWEGPDGSRVLAFNRGSYNGSISDDIATAPLDLNNRYGIEDGMFVYGVGDHGGGPTRRDVTKAMELQKQAVFPKVKFDTTTATYGKFIAQKKDYPVVRDELNFIFEGCYTTHSDIKKWNRVSENLLPTAEMFSALAQPFGFKYPRESFVTAWRNTCFNQFHDIFDGSAIHGSYAYSCDLFNQSRAIGGAALQGSLDAITEYVNTAGKGLPVVVFNPMSWSRTDAVRVPVPDSLKDKAISVRDADGLETPSQVIGDEIIFTARDVPSVGYKVFHIHDMHAPLVATRPEGVAVIENEFFRVELDDKTGALKSIFDKKASREVLSGQGDALQSLWEAPHGMSAWSIGPITKTEAVTCSGASVTSQGQVGVLRVNHVYDKSSFVQDIVLYPGVPRIEFRMTANWGQTGSGKDGGPMVKVAFPVNVKDGKARFEIPFGSIERPANGNEVPAQKWIDISNGDYGVSLVNDCKYGFDVKDSVMRMTLLRAPDNPDPKSDVGRHEINYALYPHTGDWKQADTVRRGYEFNNPLIPVIAANHPGKMPSEYSFLKVEPSNVIVTAFKKAESADDLILRFYECTGEPCKATVTLGLPVNTVSAADLAERKTGQRYPAPHGQISIPVGKWEIRTLRLDSSDALREFGESAIRYLDVMRTMQNAER